MGIDRVQAHLIWWSCLINAVFSVVFTDWECISAKRRHTE